MFMIWWGGVLMGFAIGIWYQKMRTDEESTEANEAGDQP